MSMINEKRLFKLLPNFFENSGTVVLELLQNSIRAGATRADVRVYADTLTFYDNGKGIDEASIRALLTLADSNWDKETLEQQQPAGWGFYILICIANTIKVSSLFGSLVLDCEKFLNDSSYRENIFSSIKPDCTSGVSIAAELKDLRPDLGYTTSTLKGEISLMPIDVYYNEQQIKRVDINTLANDKVWLYFCVDGNDVYVQTNTVNINASNLFMLFFGIPVGCNPYTTGYDHSLVWNARIIVNAKNSALLTPVLPYRRSIKMDQKWDDLYELIRYHLAQYWLQRLNDLTNTDMVYSILPHMQPFTSAEIDSANKWLVQTFNNLCRGPRFRYKIVTREDEPLTEYSAVLKDQSGNEDVIEFIDNDVLMQSVLPNRLQMPMWLVFKQEKLEYSVDILRHLGFIGNVSVVAATIKQIAGVSVPATVLAIEDTLYIDPATCTDIYNIYETLFSAMVYTEDGDDYDTQEHFYKEDFKQVAAQLTKKVDLDSFLSSVASYTQVLAKGIKTVQVFEERVVVTMQNGDSYTFAL